MLSLLKAAHWLRRATRDRMKTVKVLRPPRTYGCQETSQIDSTDERVRFAGPVFLTPCRLWRSLRISNTVL
ncbi:hypothetical protein EPIB1_2155 [Tritonibacter mobilis]|nr:hypothetical protein EPIB1_2155 [Tritonibacter mobilis]